MLQAIEHPLTALVTSAHLLEEDFDALSPQQMRDRIAAVHRGAFWLHAFVENVLCAATIREHRLRLRRQETHVEDVVLEVSSIVLPILARASLGLHISIPQPTPAVLADPRRIGQVIVNLLSNASQHAAAASALEISTAVRDSSVRVSVADRGPAIPEEDFPKAFESLSRPAAPPVQADEANSLGLAVSRWIVEEHGGTVGAENRSGGGASFWFQLVAL